MVLRYAQDERRPPMKLTPYWVSWWRDPSVGFELHSPWWVTGYRYVGLPAIEQASICAAIMAEDDIDARCRVALAHDREPQNLDFRFSASKAAEWSPFCDRFPRASWMVWPGTPIERPAP